MYWEVMRRAAARGCRLFDFGRSKVGTGAFAFKKNWGFAPAPLHYRFQLAPGAAIPDHNPLNPKYRLFIAAWKRLPLPVANLLGPHDRARRWAEPGDSDLLFLSHRIPYPPDKGEKIRAWHMFRASGAHPPGASRLLRRRSRPTRRMSPTLRAHVRRPAAACASTGGGRSCASLAARCGRAGR